MEEKKSGFILINKPKGPTSHAMINKLRKITGIKKIGHAGTLDPFASGLLIVAIGREATKKINQFVKLNKEYVADVRLGATSDTYDRTGKIVVNENCHITNLEEIKKVLLSFIGEQEQIPPMFSAKKVNGRKLYDLARKGIEIARKPSLIKIYNIELIKYRWPDLKIKIKCSSGTYIRSIAFDLGEKMRCGAYLEELERTAIGNFELDKANNIDSVFESDWREFLKQDYMS
jgi:tRNA pseudouridine55 synthase